jgi:hypothetical protein
VAAALALAGCRHTGGRPPPAVDSLLGARAALWPSDVYGVRLSGAVGRVPAEVVLDIGSPTSLVTAGCFKSPRVTSARVSLDRAAGTQVSLPVTAVEGFSLTGFRLRTFPAAMEAGGGCRVTLGVPQLQGLALVFDFPRKELLFEASRTQAERLTQAASPGVLAVELSRHPRFDWPLLAVRLRQGPATFTGPFVLSTLERHPTAAPAALLAAGLRRTEVLLQAVPAELRVAAMARFPSFYVQHLELAPGFEAHHVALGAAATTLAAGVLGVLGVDAWGQGLVTLDLEAGVLLVELAPAPSEGGSVQRQETTAPARDAVLELLRATANEASPAPVEREPKDP